MGVGWLVGVGLLLTACGSSSEPGTALTGTSALAALPSGMPAPPASAFDLSVARVVDGDTFVAMRSGREVRVRLIGIDAPESVKEGNPVDCFGPEASHLLARLTPPGTRLRGAYQGNEHRDRFGRDLLDVWLPDGRFLQAVLVRAGAVHARVYRPHVVHGGYLAATERLAAADHAGLHGACASTAP